MLSASPATRATIWLFSVCVHAAAFVAAGGAGKRPSADSPAATELSIDVAAAPEPASDDDPPVAATGPAVPAMPPSHATPSPTVRRSPVVAMGAPDSTAPGDAAEEVAPPNEVPVATAAPTRFTLRVESATTTGAGAPVPAITPGSDGAPLSEEAVSSPARLASAISPQYPPRAREGEIEADVVLSLVVTQNGDVADARLLRPAGFGFDESALRAARIARFAPAMRDGRRVAVRMRWTVSFRLR